MKFLDDLSDTIIHGKYSPVIPILEHTVLGGCPYCTAIRAMAFGIGLGIGSFVLIVAPIALTLYERYGNADS